MASEPAGFKVHFWALKIREYGISYGIKDSSYFFPLGKRIIYEVGTYILLLGCEATVSLLNFLY